MRDLDTDHSTPLVQRVLLALVAFLALMLLLLVAAYGGFLYGQTESSPVADETILQVTAPTATSSSTPLPTLEPAPITLESVPPTSTVPASPTPTTPKVILPDSPPAAETTIPEVAPQTESVEESEGEQNQLDLNTFNEVWRLVEREFDGALPEDKERLYGAISGSLDVLDDEYTRFIRPEIAERLREDLNGSVSGIGAIVRPNADGIVEIVRPIDNQPADLAGLEAGDLILAVDGQAVDNLDFDEVLLLVRGPAGTQVNLTILRHGEEAPREYSLIRALFEVAVVESEMLQEGSQNIAYVKLNSFTRSAEDDLLKALTDLLVQNPAGIILDLRDNGGGFLDQAVEVSDLFLPESVILYERSSSDEFDETFLAETGDLAESLPLVVLVNAGSASASEIVAGAVQDNGRGILIGETTFGKGSVQHVHTLADGAELRVTIARWFTPDNHSIGEEGIAPDIEVPTPVDLGGENDPQLQRAIDYLIAGN